VQKILDHDSPQMTARAAVRQDRPRALGEGKVNKVNAAGQPVQISPDGPLGDAAWAQQHLSRATQALLNGYYQLSLVQTCPHANAPFDLPDVRHHAGIPPAAPQHRRPPAKVFHLHSDHNASRRKPLS
jgi:hypothetical protein